MARRGAAWLAGKGTSVQWWLANSQGGAWHGEVRHGMARHVAARQGKGDWGNSAAFFRRKSEYPINVPAFPAVVYDSGYANNCHS
jgi:hypothetical protein